MSRQLHGRTYVTSVIAPRIQSILECVSNPQMVTIHALWYIAKITTTDACHVDDFLAMSTFNHLHCLGFSSLEDLVFSAFVIAARLADKSVNDTCLSSKLWECTTTIPSTILNNVERTALSSLGYLGNIPSYALHSFILSLRACSTHLSDSNSHILHRVLDDVLAVNKTTEINTIFVRYPGRKKKSAAAPRPEPPVIHAPIAVKPLTCLPDPNDWCPAADPIVNKNPRAMGIAPGSHNFAPDFRQGTTALDLLEMITQGKGPGMRSWGAAVGGPLSTIGARLAHTVGRYGPTTLG
ncbi:hypothetical protein K503DRAFT_688980 [Rhizopogon vinicolor AM-OR11-026]|uniref:Uncharacterized protein n=1 Tax=Rhizopogon vinicolor AM-OR11-026 TaxID=1314800 RepID=A0A1B7N4G4_9AGAM|nr:hypothetical protein K503DRAFT_688980 [Rhizopogon vinicolor AM-OR11-026]